LEGAALDACWADTGCDIDEVTRHYSAVVGLNTSDDNNNNNERQDADDAVQADESVVNDQTVRNTANGGGYSGVCDIQQVKEAIEECKGLEGAALDACWADTGCDIDEVTRHYSAVAGIDGEDKED